MTDQELLAQGYVALPMLPLRGLHVFPGMMLTFDVERPASITALERAVKNNQGHLSDCAEGSHCGYMPQEG